MSVVIWTITAAMAWAYTGFWVGRIHERRIINKELDDAINKLDEELFYSTEYDKHEYSVN